MSRRYLVMARGINVGTANRLSMAELRERLAAMHCSEVTTVQQSGNVILTSESESPTEVAAMVERLLVDEFDAKVPCVVRTVDQIRAVLAHNPLQDVADDPSRYLVNFLSKEPDEAAVRELMRRDHSPEVLDIEGTEAYVWTPEGVKGMTLSYSYLERQFDVVATARNWRTVEKVASRF